MLLEERELLRKPALVTRKYCIAEIHQEMAQD